MPTDNHDPEIERISVGDLRAGPIRHESLTPKQLERARIIYKCLEPLLQTPFEQFELNFLRDAHPEREIQIWSCIAAAHQRFLHQNPHATFDDAKRAYRAFLMISMRADRPPEFDPADWATFEAIYDGRCG